MKHPESGAPAESVNREMLAALHKLIETINVQTASGGRPWRDNFNDAVRTARAAIAKAEGRT